MLLTVEMCLNQGFVCTIIASIKHETQKIRIRKSFTSAIQLTQSDQLTVPAQIVHSDSQSQQSHQFLVW